MSVAIWWIRRDLRLFDNQALQAALHQAPSVLPVWIFDPKLLASPYVGDKRLAFLLAGLHALDDALRARGSRLIVRRGSPVAVLKTLQAESGGSAIFATADYSPYARRRDKAVGAILPLHLLPGVTVFPPGSVRKADGDPYRVYTPFARTWQELPRLGAEALIPEPETIVTPDGLASESLPDEPRLPDPVPFAAGEAVARRQLRAFAAGPVEAYAQMRNRVDCDGTSRLSPYLRFGMLSPREALVAADEAFAAAGSAAARKGAQAWRNELIWREFFVHILSFFPAARRQSFREKYRSIAWRNQEVEFDAWCEGRTGYPLVDAAMRQLYTTGWMHNRARMVVGSFLTKDLLIDWRWGERWFMQHLIDGDPAANNGGWQWVAGTGTDAAPYFRIFNPVSQSEKHDPDGHFIRRWVPELANVTDAYIHAPWRMPKAAQEQAGCRIGRDYPAPIVDHGEARARTLEAYKEVV
jgi:deoxyribodipyrimidine photo-lyase